jgi:hypothetical protein
MSGRPLTAPVPPARGRPADSIDLSSTPSERTTVNKRTRTALVGALAASVTGGTLAVTALTAGVHADATVPWATQDPHRSAHALSLFDSAGHAVTSGPIDQPLAAYATSSDALGANATQGSLFLHTPGTGQSGSVVVPDSGSGRNKLSTSDTDYAKQLAGSPQAVGAWTGLQLDAGTAFSTTPRADLSARAVTVAQYIAAYPSTVISTATGDGSKPVYEVRLRTSGVGTGASDAYAAADIVVDGSTWHLYGAGTSSTDAEPTTTTVAVLTAAGAKVGTALSLEASVAPKAAGSVQFKVNGTAVGAAAALSTESGKATVSYTPTAAGQISVTATFTPTDTSAYQASTSVTAASYTVLPADKVVVDTTTALRLGSGSVVTGTAVTATATVAPAAAGTVTFKDGATVLATARTGAGGVATAAIRPTAIGAHAITASFAPTDATSYSGSTSASVSLKVVDKALGKLKETFAASVKKGKKATGKVTLATPAGLTTTVTIYDGAKVLKKVTLKKGVSAKVTLPKLKKGTHKLSVRWAGNTAYKATTLAFTIKQK